MDSSSSESRQRASNFNSKEEAILLSIISKYKSIIENKKTDNNNNKQKVQYWKKIEVEFNNQSGEVFRDWNTLKKKYDNIKKRTKKKMADAKCSAMTTGGGPPKNAPEVTDIDMQITEILGSRVHGLQSEFGGDASTSNTEIITILNECEDNNEISEFSLGTPDNVYMETDYSNQEDFKNVPETESSFNTVPMIKVTGNDFKTDWSKATPQGLKTPKSKVLIPGDSSNKRQRKEYDVLCSKVSHWAEAKSSLEAVKLKHSEEEHELKLKLMKNKFEAEIELMRKETEARIERSNKEIEVTLEGIREQNKLKKEILLLEKHFLLLKQSQNSSNL